MPRTYRRPELSGANSRGWKGGRIKTTDGYIVAHAPHHPNSDSKGYVFEHRLVMEKHLGRYLSGVEVVHHKNSVKDDNRLANLQLFASASEHRKFHCPAKPCKKCQKRSVCQGLCRRHYAHWWRKHLYRTRCSKCGKDVEKRWLPKGRKPVCIECRWPNVKCRVCGKPQEARGLCVKHYQRWLYRQHKASKGI